MKDERFIVTYRIEASTYEEAKSIAWAVQVEQTIEFPYEFVTDPYIKETITGRLESLEPMVEVQHFTMCLRAHDLAYRGFVV